LAQVRRVRRIIRKFDSWTVFKVAAVFWLIVGLALVLGSVMFWSILDASGIPSSITETLVNIGLFEQGTDPFGDSERFLRVATFMSITFSAMAAALTTLSSVMYNLISDIVGGVEFIVLEETLTQAAPAPRPYQTPPRPGNGGGSGADAPTQETPISSLRR
jgi:ABC-type Fe3+ transport system permease subunit